MTEQTEQLEQTGQTESARFTDLDKIRTFLFAGRAVFTLLSTGTGNRFTFRVERAPESNRRSTTDPAYFVSLLTGPGKYSYLGLVTQRTEGKLFFRRTKASVALEGAVSLRAFSWFLEQVSARRPLPENVRFYHEGQCARCGRPLTTPESVEIGIGPECLKRLSQ